MFNEEDLMRIIGDVYKTNSIEIFVSTKKAIETKKDNITLKEDYLKIQGINQSEVYYIPYENIVYIKVGSGSTIKSKAKNKSRTTFSRIKNEKPQRKENVRSSGNFAQPRGGEKPESADWDMNERLQF